MLSKCLNPRCSATFRYLRQGRLFRLDFSEANRKNALAAGGIVSCTRVKPYPIEHFWLCASCAATMTVALGEVGLVRLVPLAPFETSARRPAAAAVPPVDKLVANAS